MKQIRLIKRYILANGILYIMLYPKNASAQEVSLNINPSITRFIVKSPSSPTAPLRIENLSEQEVTLNVKLIPFKSNNVNGQPVLDPSLLENQNYAKIADRIQILSDNIKVNTITLKGLEKKDLLLNINISSDDPSGDYYYSALFINEPKVNKQTNNSQLTSGIASNILVSIGQKESISGGIAEFRSPIYVSHGPVQFKLKLHNAGKNVIEPKGSITIENIFGQKIGNIRILPQYILANSDRYMLNFSTGESVISTDIAKDTSIPQIKWNEKFLFGWYKATATIDLDSSKPAITSSTNFIAFPIYLFIPLTILLFIVISLYLKIRRKI